MPNNAFTLTEPGWHVQPSIASVSGTLWVAWATFEPTSCSTHIHLGRCVHGIVVPEERVDTETGFVLETALMPDGTGGLWLAWVSAPTYAVTALRYRPDTGTMSPQTTLSANSTRCRNVAPVVRPGVGTWLLWEAWNTQARCQVAGSRLEHSESWSPVVPLTEPNRQAYWPTGTLRSDGRLWIATSSPNPDRTGYDCLLTCRDGAENDGPTFCLNRALCGSFHLHPHLAAGPDDTVWITWNVTTDQDYYALAGRGGNSEFCYLQDPASRARRSILWNVSVPMVRKLERDGPVLHIWQPEGTHPEDMRTAVGLLHHPRLIVSHDGRLCLLAQRFDGKRRVFETVITGPTPESWRAPASVTAGGPGAVHNGPVVACIQDHSGQLAIVGESHRYPDMDERFRRPESSSTLIATCIDAHALPDAVPQLQCVGVVGPWEPDGHPPRASASGKKMYVGNLHIHTDLSRCRHETQQSPDFNYRWAMDLLEQDFTALTDHAEALSSYQWERNRALAEFYDIPGTHVALLAYEWVTSSRTDEPCDGHVNVLFRSGKGQLFGSDQTRSSSLERLWDCLDASQVMAIPHHTATFPFRREWDKHDARFQRLLEIFQDRRGNYEYEGAPAAPGVACPEQMQEHRVKGGYALDALHEGHRVGFCSGGDHMGVSMTGVFAEALTREAVFAALYARHCYGTTHPTVHLNVTCVLGTTGRLLGMMGDEIELLERTEVTIHTKATGPCPVSEIALITPIGVRETRHPCTCEVDETFLVQVPPVGETSWFYVRIMRDDGGIAWASPIWLTGR